MVNNVCSNSVNHKEYLKKRFGLVSLPTQKYEAFYRRIYV